MPSSLAAYDVVADGRRAAVFAEPAKRAAQVDVEVCDVDAGEVAGEGGFAAARGALEEKAEVGFFGVVIDEVHVVWVGVSVVVVL